MTRRGFTLLEIMLAIALIVGLVLALITFYSYAMDARRQIVDDCRSLAAESGILNEATDDLRSALVYPFLRMGVEGSQDRVTFMVASLPGPSAWAVRTSAEDPIPPEQDISQVIYQLRVNSETQEIEGLERLSVKAFNSDMPQIGQETHLLSAAVHFLGLRYWDGANWQTSWPPAEPPPQGQTQALVPTAIEFTLGHEPIAEGQTVEEYVAANPLTIRQRIIYIPVAAGSSSGAGASAGPASSAGGSPSGGGSGEAASAGGGAAP